MDKRTIQELFDACRAGGDDLQLPEMAPLAERLADDPALADARRRANRFDAAVGDAFDDVPVPDGLQDRLVESLRSAGSAEASAVERAVPRVWTRRRVLAASLAALSAGVLVAVGVRLFPREPIDPDQLAGLAGGWTNSLSSEGWSDQIDAALPLARPIPDSVLALPEAWQTRSTQYDSAAVAYRLGNGRRGAVLFVLDGAGRESDLSGSPPPNPRPGTGGWQFGVWQSDGLVFVLAVEGSRADYRRLVKTAIDA